MDALQRSKRESSKNKKEEEIPKGNSRARGKRKKNMCAHLERINQWGGGVYKKKNKKKIGRQGERKCEKVEDRKPKGKEKET